MEHGCTEAETCALNGWTVGTVLRGHEQWSDGKGIWTTIRITAIGEEAVLARTVWEERTGPNGKILSECARPDREGTWTLAFRDWQVAEERNSWDGGGNE